MRQKDRTASIGGAIRRAVEARDFPASLLHNQYAGRVIPNKRAPICREVERAGRDQGILRTGAALRWQNLVNPFGQGRYPRLHRCAGAEYPLVATGALDFAIYWRTLVWDHAPGVLIVQEAGGKAARLDGAPYRPAIRSGSILLAHAPDIWDQAAAILSR